MMSLAIYITNCKLNAAYQNCTILITVSYSIKYENIAIAKCATVANYIANYIASQCNVPVHHMMYYKIHTIWLEILMEIKFSKINSKLHYRNMTDINLVK